MTCEILYGVKNGKFYVRSPPTFANDNWISSATKIGSAGWGAFSHGRYLIMCYERQVLQRATPFMFIWPLDRKSHPYWPRRMGFVQVSLLWSRWRALWCQGWKVLQKSSTNMQWRQLARKRHSDWEIWMVGLPIPFLWPTRNLVRRAKRQVL